MSALIGAIAGAVVALFAGVTLPFMVAGLLFMAMGSSGKPLPGLAVGATAAALVLGVLRVILSIPMFKATAATRGACVRSVACSTVCAAGLILWPLLTTGGVGLFSAALAGLFLLEAGLTLIAMMAEPAVDARTVNPADRRAQEAAAHAANSP